MKKLAVLVLLLISMQLFTMPQGEGLSTLSPEEITAVQELRAIKEADGAYSAPPSSPKNNSSKESIHRILGRLDFNLSKLTIQQKNTQQEQKMLDLLYVLADGQKSMYAQLDMLVKEQERLKKLLDLWIMLHDSDNEANDQSNS